MKAGIYIQLHLQNVQNFTNFKDLTQVTCPPLLFYKLKIHQFLSKKRDNAVSDNAAYTFISANGSIDVSIMQSKLAGRTVQNYLLIILCYGTLFRLFICTFIHYVTGEQDP